MEAVIATVHFDVELSGEERAAIHRILENNRMRLNILPVASLAVRVRIELEQEKDKKKGKRR